MSTKALLECTDIAGLVCSVAITVQMCRTKAASGFPNFAWFLIANLVRGLVTVPILFFRKSLHIDISMAYAILFYSQWVLFLPVFIALILVIYELYQRIMAPFAGLQKIGSVVFRWVAVVGTVLSLGLALGPHPEKLVYVRMLAERVEQGSSVLALCLLLFVCAAAKPLGITYRSRIFGVTLGIGVVATSTLIEGAWFGSNAPSSVYSPVYLLSSCGFLLACGIWGWYFVMPEPASRMVLMPTTSPFFLWNRVSEALGDEPGYVAVSGFRPDMLEPAEITVLTAASVAARERKVREAAAFEAAREEAALAQSAMQQSGTLHSLAMQR